MTWTDHRKEAFDDRGSAELYRRSIPKDLVSRVVQWDEMGSHPVKTDDS
jgi:hypothetical protein